MREAFAQLDISNAADRLMNSSLIRAFQSHGDRPQSSVHNHNTMVLASRDGVLITYSTLVASVVANSTPLAKWEFEVGYCESLPE